MPSPDKRVQLRAEIEAHRRAADAAKREMGRLALELAEAAVERLTSIGPQPVCDIAEQFCKARNNYLDETLLAGRAVRRLGDEEVRMATERIAEMKEASNG